MFICFEKYSSVINLDLIWKHLFSYTTFDCKYDKASQIDDKFTDCMLIVYYGHKLDNAIQNEYK